MKIIQKTEQSLVLKENKWALFFVGCALIIGGLIALFYSLSGASMQPWWYGVMGAIVGSFLIIATSVITIIFDKSANMVLVTRKSLLRKNENTYPLDQVSAIELRFDSVVRNNPSSLDTSKNISTSLERPTYVYKLVAVLKDGQEFFITTLSTGSSARVSMNISGTIEARAGVQDTIGPTIAEFLGVPYQKQSESPEAKFFNNILQS